MMTSSSMPEQEHGRSPPETVTMASDEPQPRMPAGLDPAATGRSDAAGAMVTGGGAGDNEELMVMAVEGPLDDLVLVGTSWGSLLLAPTPLSSVKQEEEVSAPPCPVNIPTAAKGAKQCVQCGATETPQWRIQPMGQGALCNACRIRLRPAEALREPVHVHHLPPPATATATAVISESPADGWISESWVDFDAYLLKEVTSPSPRRERSPSPTTEPAPAPENKKQKRKRKPYHSRKSSKKKCQHCKSTSTPQWRTGPKGPGTLCNACGVRYRQGRLLQEYRPAASPSFKPSEHACKHREVLQLSEEKYIVGKEEQHQPPEPGAGDGMEQQGPPPPAQAHASGDELATGEPISLDQLLCNAIDGSPETHIVFGVGDDLQMGDYSCSLDQFLFDGPAAPPLIDDDDDDLAD